VCFIIFLIFNFFGFRVFLIIILLTVKNRQKKATVIVFPGSNCDKEAADILNKYGFQTTFTWHSENLPSDIDLCFIPGGFSYGDYLRSGAVAAREKIMNQVRNFAENGGFVIGICNGFQILTEAKILPGALMQNACGHFVCKITDFKTENKDSIFTKNLKENVKIQVAHGDGRYTADSKTLEMLEKENRIAFRYEDNYNGSAQSIAGIIGGKNYNILGMMPHPERTLASADCVKIFENLSKI
jgi:phosphoribosylformylglycinamidine synthase I